MIYKTYDKFRWFIDCCASSGQNTPSPISMSSPSTGKVANVCTIFLLCLVFFLRGRDYYGSIEHHIDGRQYLGSRQFVNVNLNLSSPLYHCKEQNLPPITLMSNICLFNIQKCQNLPQLSDRMWKGKFAGCDDTIVQAQAWPLHITSPGLLGWMRRWCA